MREKLYGEYCQFRNKAVVTPTCPQGLHEKRHHARFSDRVFGGWTIRWLSIVRRTVMTVLEAGSVSVSKSTDVTSHKDRVWDYPHCLTEPLTAPSWCVVFNGLTGLALQWSTEYAGGGTIKWTKNVVVTKSFYYRKPKKLIEQEGCLWNISSRVLNGLLAWLLDFREFSIFRY